MINYFGNSTRHVSIKSAIWANNTPIEPHPKEKFINELWKLKLRPKLLFFAWKLAKDILPTRGKLRNLGMSTW